MKKLILMPVLFILILITSCGKEVFLPEESVNDLVFDSLATRWDESIPLGNGIMGVLVWKKDDKLRFSLDRADLWDLRPMENLNTPEWKYSWVYRQWLRKDYRLVQEKFDLPYNRNPAPSKIPAGALEFDIKNPGKVKSVRLYLKNALCEIKWENGARLLVFVQADKPVGWYLFEGMDKNIKTELVSPPYNIGNEFDRSSPVTGQDLCRLGYKKGTIYTDRNSIIYNQEGWGGFKYQISVKWKRKGDILEGCWSISSEFPGWKKHTSAREIVTKSLNKGFINAFSSHNDWWQKFWSKSSISLPDRILEKQWYLEQYKFGSAARNDTPPISLQAVWTADNGKLPPWKGDFHHDLNTQFSYWPAYSANHLDLEKGFLNWLWKCRPVFKRYTGAYFGTSGLNVPGVTTLTGEPMGGWIQYSFGPTVSAWLGQHFYLHWRYSMDKKFLKEKAYPWLRDVATHIMELSVIGKNGKRKLPISSSPEVNNNSRDAWFGKTTNFDLALIRWTFEKTAELADELGKTEEAKKWRFLLEEWPDLDIDNKTGLTIAPGFPYKQSHRHFSHLLAIHPLGLIDWSKGERDRNIIEKSLRNLEKYGTDWWVGYSFSWLGNLYARAFNGEKAAEALRIFATCFCLPNSFHINGDQSGKGYSKFTYRPFTLEGNFAFAAGIQEMLIQSHTGIIRIFPAIPDDWNNVAFNQLRAEGAFLITAKRKNGQVVEVIVKSEKGGEVKLLNPFPARFTVEGGKLIKKGNILTAIMTPGQVIKLSVR